MRCSTYHLPADLLLLAAGCRNAEEHQELWAGR
jgi:hypothetical protein